AARKGGGASGRGDEDGRLHGGRDRLLREAPAELHRSLIETVDYHTGVEPLEGATILDKRRFALERLDHVRRLLVYEPRGHADMYGCFVVEPDDDGADIGV